MLKNLIVIEGDQKVQCDDEKELTKILLGKDFFELSETEKKKRVELKAVANSLGRDIEIIDDINKLNIKRINNTIIIIDEKTYILSLLSTNKIMLLESVNSNVFIKYIINKINFTKNYIIVNNFAKQILKNYIALKYNHEIQGI